MRQLIFITIYKQIASVIFFKEFKKMKKTIKNPFKYCPNEAIATLCMVCLFVLAALTTGCNRKNDDDQRDEDLETFCSFVSVESMDKTIPFVDEFLAGLPNDLGVEQKLQTLAAWLKQQPCIIDAAVFCALCVETDLPMSEIAFSFDENGETVEMILDISMTNPLKVTDYHDMPEEVLQGSIEEITVKVENASEYSHVVEVKVYGHNRSTGSIELARGDWKGDGFTIELPKTVNQNYLLPISEDWLWLTTFESPPFIIMDLTKVDTLSNLTISNKNVRFIESIYFGGYDINDLLVATFSAYKYDGGTTNHVLLTYVDSDVTISGYNRKSVYSIYDALCHDCSPHFSEITKTYSIEWKKGWNVWYLSTLRTGIPGRITTSTEHWSTAPVCGVKWYGYFAPIR